MMMVSSSAVHMPHATVNCTLPGSFPSCYLAVFAALVTRFTHTHTGSWSVCCLLEGPAGAPSSHYLMLMFSLFIGATKHLTILTVGLGFAPLDSVWLVCVCLAVDRQIHAVNRDCNQLEAKLQTRRRLQFPACVGLRRSWSRLNCEAVRGTLLGTCLPFGGA